MSSFRRTSAPYLFLGLLTLALCGACKEDQPSGTPMPSGECTLSEADQSTIEALEAGLAYPFEGPQPGVADAGLDPLIDYLGSAPFVGLGEATHGTAEFYAMKDKIFRRLVEDKGFKAIVFEIPWGNALVVNDYVLNGDGELNAVVDQTYYWIYDTEEVRTLVEWMRNYNDGRPEAEKIHFVGCDPQGGGFTEEIQRVRAYLEEVAPDSSDSVLSQYNRLPFSNLSAYAAASADRHQANRTGTQSVVDFFLENQAAFTASTDPFSYEVAYMAAHLIQQREYIYRTSGNGVPRDSLMAVYSEWWQRILGPETKVAIWAHNNHVMDATSMGAEWMGTFLRRRWSEKYKNLGFSFGQGSFNAFVTNRNGQLLAGVQRQSLGVPNCGSTNQFLSELPGDQHYLIFEELATAEVWHFHNPHPFLQFGAGFNPEFRNDFERDHELARLFDVLIHFDQTQASVLR